MATPPRISDRPEVQQQYLAQLALTAALFQALRSLWLSVQPLWSAAAMQRYRGGVAVVVDHYAQVGASTARDYYLESRRGAGLTDSLTVPAAPSPPRSLIDAGLDWATRETQRIEVGLAADMAELEAVMQSRVEAAMQKAMTDASREQVVVAVDADDQALGYRRVPRPGACYFCITMAIRSTSRTGLAKDFKKYVPGSMGGQKHYGIYKSRATAGEGTDPLFTGAGEAKFHNNCHCVIEAVFAPVEGLPDWLADMERLYDQTEGGLQEFRKAVAASRRGETPEPPALPVLSPPKPIPQAQIDALLDLLPQVA